MGNFIENRARETQIAESAMDGVRIIRADELTRIQIALGTATDALMRAKSSERTAQALCEINEVQCLIGGIALTNDRRPPIEFAAHLETQTRVVERRD